MNLFRLLPERLRRRMFRYTPSGFPDARSCGTFYDVRHTVFSGDEMMILEYSGREAQERLFARATALLSPRGRVLDLGCGFGHLIDYFERNGQAFDSYCGVDVSGRMVAEARRAHAGNARARFEQRDLLVEPFETGAFDTGYILSVLGYPIGDEPMETMLRIVSEAFAACREGIVFSHLATGRKAGLRFTTVPEALAERCERAIGAQASLDDDPADFTYLLALRRRRDD